MAALVAALLIHPADRLAARARLIAARHGRPGRTLALAALAALLAYGVAATAGALLGPHLTPEACGLFVALSLLFAGAAGLLPAKPPEAGPAALGGLVALSLAAWGDRLQFVVATLAARSDAPVAATAGAMAGTLAVTAALLAIGRPRRAALLALRLATGLLLIAVGAVMALGALRLI